ncbi:monocarboxylate transporter 13-like [Pomacea canaliculata]|uniref:monocarboxylate transporter 13-like n=1 Tax=Pomacea canaliculata TaxID=400727 RepID=UPI000D72BC78|nr:monocarboxylate transporter 13-like [Pomacea canaliculata]XP_025079501.1 monocarboxylate transporter 13-like [Pomacea canaliculata]XP_025079502.1 monocarboxylate transporter 13-like [Pomacea canaliculata]XP_025079503.1 monocarboxylate transporter 13-like [Pomacea canaliculata]XP_025079504.1 monocarboxylate transporter 13-like [Pomacea canaliculata]
MSKAPKRVAPADLTGLPVDRGYAWVIAFACMFCTTIGLGLLRSYGVLFVEFLRMFNMSAGMTAVILAAQAGVNSIAALLIQTVVLSFLSVRQTVVIGGFLGGLGLILSYFAESIYVLFFSFSFLLGISLSTITGPCLLIVGTYFNKRRSLASAIATLGVSTGSVVIPPYTQALIAAFGGRGSLLVLGATYMNIMVGGMLLRPFHLNKRRLESVDDADTDKAYKSTETLPRASLRHMYRQRSLSVRSRDSIDVNAIGSILSLDVIVAMPEITVEVIDEVSDDEGKTEIDHAVTTTNAHHVTDERDISVRDSHSRLDDDNIAVQSPALNGEGPSLKHVTDDEEVNFCWKCLSFFDFGLFRRPPFLAIIISCSLGVVPVLMYGTYLPALASDRGLSDEEAATLLSIFGVSSFLSRLFFGFVADLNVVPRWVLMSSLMFLTTLTGMFTPLYKNYLALAVFSASYGLFAPVFFSLAPVLVVDLLGLENLSKTLGFMSLFQGIGAATAHPIIGYLRDVTGSYHPSFFFMAACGLCSSGVLVLLNATRSLKQRCQRSQTVVEEDAAEDVSQPLNEFE